MSEIQTDLPLNVRSLSFSYGKKQILDNISFYVNKGMFSVLLGVNGAGKTTLFSLITHLYSADSGQITVFGYDLKISQNKALASMGVVFQSSTLDSDLSIKQNFLYYGALHNIGADEVIDFMVENLPIYLPDCKEDQKVRQLSGGQKRNIELMRSLMSQPQLLLLDEPTVGLDIKSRAQFTQLVRKLCKSNNIGVLWATHLADEVSDTDNVIILNKGKVLTNGVANKILQDTQTNNIEEAFFHLTNKDSESQN